MKITVEAEPKEIAALVEKLQGNGSVKNQNAVIWGGAAGNCHGSREEWPVITCTGPQTMCEGHAAGEGDV